MMAFMMILPTMAVLKEKSLAQTLSVLLAELQAEHAKQQTMKQMYESQSATQHETLIQNMQKCEQIGLMLYSQKSDYTFDMAYACQEATKLHTQLMASNRMPFDKIKKRIEQEIERYDALILSLKQLPPVEKDHEEEVLTEADTILMQAMDSLQAATDSIKQAGGDTIAAMTFVKQPDMKEDSEPNEPYLLTDLQRKQRKECLELAEAIRNNMVDFLEKLTNDNLYYESVHKKAEDLYKFAQTRYGILQQNIFVNGGNNYFHILSNIRQYTLLAGSDVGSKYRAFEGKERDFSQWRGVNVVFISLFTLIYLAIALVISYITLRWLLPKSWRSRDFKLKRRMLNNVVGIALFGVMVMVARRYVTDNALVTMGTGLMVSMAWILEAIFLSLYIRLRGSEMLHAAKVYSPLMCIAIVIILFRIVLIPNSLVNLILPPIMLCVTLWQILITSKARKGLGQIDAALVYITTLTMTVTCITTWIGYTLLAVEIMLWWIFQLAAIQTIVCIYDMMELFEVRFLVKSLKPALYQAQKEGKDVSSEVDQLIAKLKHGDYISKTWLYDFVKKTVVPILAVGSVLTSIAWTADIFEMRAMCKEVLMTYFIDEPKVIQLSLFKICVVVSSYFIFRYINYLTRSIYRSVRKANLDDTQSYNGTLAKNVVAILVWGSYFVFCLVFLRVPGEGISMITAGLATGLGFAMKDLLENFFYGLSLMTGRLHVGDYIECDGIRGKVESITYQSTQITTMDGCVIAFLNSALFSQNFKNLTRNHRYELLKIPVGVAYGSNVDEVRKMILEDIQPLCQSEGSNGMPITSPDTQASVVFSDFGDNSVDLLLCVWVLVEDCASFRARARETIYNTLNAHNIEIPFPQRDIYVRSLPSKD